MDLLDLIIPGDPVPKGRPRFTRKGHAYTDARTVAAEKVIADLTSAEVDAPYDGLVGVNLTFYCATRRLTDGDNLQKLVLDAMNKVVFADDHLVHESFWRVFRKLRGQEPRTEIRVYTLEDLPPEPDQ